jgi:hypothetical protein
VEPGVKARERIEDEALEIVRSPDEACGGLTNKFQKFLWSDRSPGRAPYLTFGLGGQLLEPVQVRISLGKYLDRRESCGVPALGENMWDAIFQKREGLAGGRARAKS